MTWEIEFNLIFWHIRGICTIKWSCKFHSFKVLLVINKASIYLIKLQKLLIWTWGARWRHLGAVVCINGCINLVAARLIFYEPKRMHVTPLFIDIHWLPICSHKIWGLNVCLYKTTNGSTPLYLNSLLQTFMPSRSVHSASECRFIVPSQRGTKSLSQTFKLNVSSWWNDLPNSIRTAESLPIFKKRLKTHLFHLYLTL